MTIDRALLAQAFPKQLRVQSAFERQSETVTEIQDGTNLAIAATEALNDATFVTLSPNATLNGERILKVGRGIKIEVDANNVKLSVDKTVPNVVGGFEVFLNAAGATSLILPDDGTLATTANLENLKNKTLVAPKMSGLGNYANDAAAAGGGVPVGGIYHTAGALKIRLV